MMDMLQTVRTNDWTLTLDDGQTFPITEFKMDAAPVEYIRSESAVMPDPGWSATDTHGHVHRWASTDRRDVDRAAALPTLVASTEHIACEDAGPCLLDGCEGYDITVWHCAVCGDKVEPGYRPDYQARTTGIPIVVGQRPPIVLTVSGMVTLPSELEPSPMTTQGRYGGVASRMVGRGWVGDRRRVRRAGSTHVECDVHFIPDSTN
jgi:hypothetical protein